MLSLMSLLRLKTHTTFVHTIVENSADAPHDVEDSSVWCIIVRDGRVDDVKHVTVFLVLVIVYSNFRGKRKLMIHAKINEVR